MSKTNSSSNSHETHQVSQGNYQRDGLAITPQNIKPPPVKPPKQPQAQSQSQQPQSKK